MRPTLLAAATCLVASPALADLGDPGPFLAGFRQVTVTRPPAQGGGTFTARLFYPALAAGQNTAINPAGGPYPAVSFGHGFFQPVSVYQSTLLHLASHGYLVIATDSEGGLFPSHSNFARDLRVSLTFLEEQNALPGSFLQGLVNTAEFGLSGHSMGGGAGILAAVDPRVDAVAPLAAADTNPSSIAASSNFFIPVRHIVGSADSIVPPTTTIQMFNNSARAKQFVSLLGGFHCGFVDSQGFGCDSGSMTRADQLRYTRRLLVEFFNLYLKNDQSAWQELWLADTQTDPRVIYTSAPDSALAPATQTITVRAGASADAALTLTNLGPAAAGFDVLAFNSPWPVAPASIGPLAPGAAAPVALPIAPPLSAAPGQAAFVISARSGRDAGTRSTARLTVNIACPADFNTDGVVDFNDLLEYLNLYNALDPEADLNADGVIDFNDLLEFLNRYNLPCP
jgi:dienelactone hydrolase